MNGQSSFLPSTDTKKPTSLQGPLPQPWCRGFHSVISTADNFQTKRTHQVWSWAADAPETWTRASLEDQTWGAKRVRSPGMVLRFGGTASRRAGTGGRQEGTGCGPHFRPPQGGSQRNCDFQGRVRCHKGGGVKELKAAEEAGTGHAAGLGSPVSSLAPSVVPALILWSP